MMGSNRDTRNRSHERIPRHGERERETNTTSLTGSSRCDSADWLTMAEASKLAPGRPSSNAIWRWCRKGVKSRGGGMVRLEHFRAGRRVFTTREALFRFFEELADADVEHFDRDQQTNDRRSAPSTRDQRKREIDRARASLDRARI